MALLDPAWIAISVAVLLFSVLIGRLRKHRPIDIAVSTGGFLLFLWGLRWAGSLGGEAFLAAGAASLGSLLFTAADERRRARRAERRSVAT